MYIRVNRKTKVVSPLYSCQRLLLRLGPLQTAAVTAALGPVGETWVYKSLVAAVAKPLVGAALVPAVPWTALTISRAPNFCNGWHTDATDYQAGEDEATIAAAEAAGVAVGAKSGQEGGLTAAAETNSKAAAGINGRKMLKGVAAAAAAASAAGALGEFAVQRKKRAHLAASAAGSRQMGCAAAAAAADAEFGAHSHEAPDAHTADADAAVQAYDNVGAAAAAATDGVLGSEHLKGHGSGAVCWYEQGSGAPLTGGHFKLQFGTIGSCFTLALQPPHGTCTSFFTHELLHRTEPVLNPGATGRFRLGTAMITNKHTLDSCALVYERGQEASWRLKQTKGADSRVAKRQKQQQSEAGACTDAQKQGHTLQKQQQTLQRTSTVAATGAPAAAQAGAQQRKVQARKTSVSHQQQQQTFNLQCASAAAHQLQQGQQQDSRAATRRQQQNQLQQLQPCAGAEGQRSNAEQQLQPVQQQAANVREQQQQQSGANAGHSGTGKAGKQQQQQPVTAGKHEEAAGEQDQQPSPDSCVGPGVPESGNILGTRLSPPAGPSLGAQLAAASAADDWDSCSSDI
jgi:hypothetical protein